MNNDFSYTILEYINNAIRNNAVKPLNLGGISASGGGSGTPPGGFVGYLPQTRVAYDLSESESPTASGSLLDNLNHMRYRLAAVEEVTSLSGGHLILDEGIPVTPRVNLDFVGEGVSLSDDSETGTTIVTVEGGDDSGVLSITTVTTTTTLNETHTTVLVDCTTGNLYIYLPNAVEYEGKVYTIGKVDSSAYYIRVSSSDYIDGSGNDVYLRNQWENLTLQSDGTDWFMTKRPTSSFVPEGSYLQIGGNDYPTTSQIRFGDSSYVVLYEKYDDVFAAKAGMTDFLVAGYDPVTPYGYTILLGDVDGDDNGYYLKINQDGFTLNGNVTISGDIYADNIVYEAPLGAITYGRQNGAWVAVSGSGVTTSGGHVIMDEGTPLTQRDYLNFVGSGVTVTDGTIGGESDSYPVLDATASSDLDTAATYLELEHVLGSGSDRIVLVGVAHRVATSTSVTFNSVPMTLVRRDRPGSDVCSELWYMLEDELPVAGTYTIRVNASESQKFVVGSISYSNCLGLVANSATGGNGSSSWSDVPMIDPFTGYQVLIDIIALQEGGNSVTEGDVGQYAFCNENTGYSVGGMSWKVWEEEGEYDGSIWIFGNSSVWASTIVALQGGSAGINITTVTIDGITDADSDGITYGRKDGAWINAHNKTSTTVSTSQALTVDYDIVYIDCGSGSSGAMTIPDASTCAGTILTLIVSAQTGSYYTRINALGGSLIDGQAYIWLQYLNETMELISDGTNWLMLTRPAGYFVPEGEILRIGSRSETPTASKLIFGDSTYTGIYEKYDDCITLFASAHDVLSAGWDTPYENYNMSFGDLEAYQHGNYLEITASGFAFNSDVTISGNLNVTTGATGSFTTADSKTVTVVGGIITSIV